MWTQFFSAAKAQSSSRTSLNVCLMTRVNSIAILCYQYEYKTWIGQLKMTKNLILVGKIQGCAKTRVFHQKPSPVGLTGLHRVLMG